MKRQALLWTAAVVVLLPLCSIAQTVDAIDPALRDRIDRIAAGVMEQRGVPSASIAVVQGGKLVYTHAYGRARIDPRSSGRCPRKMQPAGFR